MGWQDAPAVDDAAPAKPDPRAARAQFAAAASAATGVPEAAILAHVALETGRDGSKTVGQYNYGNIKAGSKWQGATASVNAVEYDKAGNAYREPSKFRAYSDPEQAAQDYAALIRSRYPQAAQARTVEDFAQGLKAGGYATDPDYVRKLVAVAGQRVGTERGRKSNPSATPSWMLAPEVKDEPTKSGRGVAGMAGDLLAGAVRGAGSIGATLLYPIDKGMDLYYGDRVAAESRNDERRRLMTEALGTLGADTDSASFAVGKFAGEAAGTAGAGGAVANAARVALPAAAAARVAPLLSAIETGGIGGAANLPTRIAGGAIAGGTMGAMIDPREAAGGAVAGALLPVAGAGLRALRSAVSPEAANPQILQAARDAAARGYVIPPSDIQPQGMLTEALGGLSGKIKTAQVASARNQSVTNDLARQALGLPEGTAITPDTLAAVRQQAGKAYEAVRGAGTVVADKAYADALDKIVAQSQGAERSFPGLSVNPVNDVIATLKRPQFDAGDAVDAIRSLRDMADSAYAKGDKAIGAAYKQASGALEDALDRHLSATGQADALQAMRTARQTIAKTYTLAKAANATTGDINAQVLAGQLAKGRPLSGELAQIASTAAAFPKATQALKEAPKSLSPLDFLGAGAAGLGHPLGLATIAARPAARSLLLSPAMQARALKDASPGVISQALAAGDSEALNKALLTALIEEQGNANARSTTRPRRGLLD